MAEQKQELENNVQKEKDANPRLGGVPEYRGSEHVLLTIDTAPSLQLHGTSKSLMRLKE